MFLNTKFKIFVETAYFMSTPYSLLLVELKTTIRDARDRAIRQVNRALIERYWEVGRQIVKSQTEHGWGKSVVEDLARDLRLEFPKSTGFSPRNLWDMRRFYVTYKDFPNPQALTADLGWTQNRELLSDKLPNRARAFYLKAAAEGNWPYRTLHQK
jgi:hypothetical protein